VTLSGQTRSGLGPSLRWQGVSKRFGGVEVLHAIDLDVQAGSCHALMGENGAGKSTLARIAAGIHRPDGGELCIDGRPRRLRSPADALAAGVAMLHQELACCPQLSVAENLALGRWPRRGLLVDGAAMLARARQLLADIGPEIDVAAPMGSLSVAQEQLVQIAAAVGTGARALLLDEPTSSLSEGEAARLFELLAELRARGTTLVYVSHRLPEVLALCDRMTVLRDGALVGTLERADADESTLVRMMLGRDLEQDLHMRPPSGSHAGADGAGLGSGASADGVPSQQAIVAADASPADYGSTGVAANPIVSASPDSAAPDEILLDVQGLSSPTGPTEISLCVRRGEILGLAGLVGAGRSELLAALFGLDRAARGRVRVGGEPLALGDVRAAVAAGLGLVPEDRKRQGLVPALDAADNHGLGRPDPLRRGPLLSRRAERARAAAAHARVDLRGARPGLPVSSLSGGNQQKVVLARWIDRGVRVLLVDEPTRGVDVGAKAQIHALLRELAAGGTALLLASSELPELLALCTRVLVLREGRVVAELAGAQLKPESTLAAMTGVTASCAP